MSDKAARQQAGRIFWAKTFGHLRRLKPAATSQRRSTGVYIKDSSRADAFWARPLPGLFRGGGQILVLGRPSALPPTYRQLHDRQMEGLRQALPAARFTLVPFDLACEAEISPLISRGEAIGPAEIALFTARSPGAAAVVVLDYGFESASATARQGPPVYIISIGEPGNLQALVDRGQVRAGVVIPVGPDNKGAAPAVIR